MKIFTMQCRAKVYLSHETTGETMALECFFHSHLLAVSYDAAKEAFYNEVCVKTNYPSLLEQHNEGGPVRNDLKYFNFLKADVHVLRSIEEESLPLDAKSRVMFLNPDEARELDKIMDASDSISYDEDFDDDAFDDMLQTLDNDPSKLN